MGKYTALSFIRMLVSLTFKGVQFAVVNIDSAYVQSFENNVRFIAQQKEAKLRGRSQTKSESSQKHNWEILGTLEAAEKTSARTATPVQDAEWTRRVSLAKTYHIGTSTELEDPVQMLVDPNSNITRAVAMGMNRQFDDVFIEAATADALLGDGTTLAFDVNQVVGDGTAPISFDYVTEVQEKFMQNDIDPEVPKCFVVGPTQIRKLMQLTEQTSNDYVSAQRLLSYGIVPNWLGFTWINSTRLLSPGAGEIDCLAFTMDAMGMNINTDISAKVAQDPSLSFAWRIYSHMTLGAVRVEDQQIVRAHLLDSL
ncbi:MAG: hypothetical protein DRQ39_10705 [Gammaproteobacteria bacterium]|nr:MAG: hypothetical protein DRQ39_10705 [Gammaproteobacteria bacterium]